MPHPVLPVLLRMTRREDVCVGGHPLCPPAERIVLPQRTQRQSISPLRFRLKLPAHQAPRLGKRLLKRKFPRRLLWLAAFVGSRNYSESKEGHVFTSSDPTVIKMFGNDLVFSIRQVEPKLPCLAFCVYSSHIQVRLDQVADEFSYVLPLQMGKQFQLVVLDGCKLQVWFDPDRSLSSLRIFSVLQNGFREELTYTDLIFQAVFENLVVFRRSDVGRKKARARCLSAFTKPSAMVGSS